MTTRRRHAIPKWQILGRGEEQPNVFGDGEVYMTLYPLLRTPWFALILRRIDLPDTTGILHTHGFDFWSLILRGGYVEMRERGPVRKYKRGSINKIKANEGHRIMRLERTPTWTLALNAKWRGFKMPELVHKDGSRTGVWEYYSMSRGASARPNG